MRKFIIFAAGACLLVFILWRTYLWCRGPALRTKDPVYQAIYAGDAERLDMLLRQGHRLASEGPSGRVPLTEAIYWWWPSRRRGEGDTEEASTIRKTIAHNLVAVLLRHGANPNDKTRNDEVPIFWAITWNMRDTVRLLLRSGAHVNVFSREGWPILYYAIAEDSCRGSQRYVKLLLEFGAAPNIKDGDENTVLHLAIQNKIPVRYVLPLIAAGLDIEIRNKDGETALEIAERENLTEYIELLKAALN